MCVCADACTCMCACYTSKCMYMLYLKVCPPDHKSHPPDQYAVSNIARQGEHIVVLEALTNHSGNPDVVAYGFQTLKIIARCVGSGLTGVRGRTHTHAHTATTVGSASSWK